MALKALSMLNSFQVEAHPKALPQDLLNTRN